MCEIGREKVILLRRFGLHERFHSARDNIGSPPLLCCAALLSLDDQLGGLSTLRDALLERIRALLDAYPLLSAHVHNATSREPQYAVRSQPRVRPESVLSYLSPSTDGDAGDLSEAVGPHLARLIAARIHNVGMFDIGQAPLWRVEIIPQRHDGHPGPTAALVLTVHHALADGRGFVNTFEYLCGKGQTPAIHRWWEDKEPNIPPASDQVVQMAPTASYLLPIFFKEIVLPKLPLPASVRSYLQGAPPWPAQAPASRTKAGTVPPIEAKKRLRVLTFRGAVPQLKALGQRHGIDTINPLVHTACILASFTAAEAAAESNGRSPPSAPAGARKPLDHLELGTMTAISERGEVIQSQGLPAATPCTGNFVSDMPFTSRVTRGDDFWDLSKRYGAEMKSSSGRRKARSAMGVLGYLPDAPDFSKSLPVENPAPIPAQRPNIATQWEHYFWTKSRGPTPFWGAVGLSNLGRIDLSDVSTTLAHGTHVDHVAWAQRPSASGCAFTVDVCGLKAEAGGTPSILESPDLSISVGYHVGALSSEANEDIEEAFVKVLEGTVLECIRLGAAAAEDQTDRWEVGSLLDVVQGRI